MFFKIIQIIQLILSFILEAEWNFHESTGPEKRAGVMKASAAELRRQGLLPDGDEEKPGGTLSYIGNIIDGLVGLFNTTGVFRRSASSSSSTPAHPEPDPPAEN